MLLSQFLPTPTCRLKNERHEHPAEKLALFTPLNKSVAALVA
ncbi:hypothetical protein [Oceanisphaera sp.]